MIRMARDLGTRIYPVFPTWRKGSLTRRKHGNATISFKGDDGAMQYVFDLDEGVLGLKFLFWFSAPFINMVYRPATEGDTDLPLPNHSDAFVSMTSGSAVHASSIAALALHYRILLLPTATNPNESLQSATLPATQLEPPLPAGTTTTDLGSNLFWKDRGNDALSGSHRRPSFPYTHSVFGQFYIPSSGTISDSAEPNALCPMRGKIAFVRNTIQVGSNAFYLYSPGVYVVETAINTAGFRKGVIEFAVGNLDGAGRYTINNVVYQISLDHWSRWNATNTPPAGTPIITQRPLALFVRGIATAVEI